MNRLTKISLTTVAALALFVTGALASPTFTDWEDSDQISEGHAESVMWADGNALVQGYPDGTFRPGVPVSRQQASSLLHRYHQRANWMAEGEPVAVAAGDIATVEGRCADVGVAVAGGYDISGPQNATEAAQISVLQSQVVEGEDENLPYSAWAVHVANGSAAEVTVQVSALCTMR